jgi:CheY-like chemotaxis protein
MIIIVDDSVVSLKMVRRMVEVELGKNISVKLFEDGLLAVDGVADIIQKSQYDLIDAIIMDYHMPTCSGTDVIQQIRQLEKDNNTKNQIPIIGFSADLSSEVSDAMLAAGANFILEKPLRSGELGVLCKPLVKHYI